MYVQIVHLALGNENGGVHQIYESAGCLAWGLIFGRRKMGVLSVSSLFLTRVGTQDFVVTCARTTSYATETISSLIQSQEGRW